MFYLIFSPYFSYFISNFISYLLMFMYFHFIFINAYVFLSVKGIIINMDNFEKRTLTSDIKLTFKCLLKKRVLAAEFLYYRPEEVVEYYLI